MISFLILIVEQLPSVLHLPKILERMEKTHLNFKVVGTQLT